jgi:hypothetical protein
VLDILCSSKAKFKLYKAKLLHVSSTAQVSEQQWLHFMSSQAHQLTDQQTTLRTYHEEYKKSAKTSQAHISQQQFVDADQAITAVI